MAAAWQLLLTLMLALMGCVPTDPGFIAGTDGGLGGSLPVGDVPTVHMPFPSGTVWRCTQGAGGSYSHSGNSTRYDVDFDTPNPPNPPAEVFAPMSGTLWHHEAASGFGQHVNIQFADGLFVVIGHLVAGSVPFGNGQWVEAGAHVGQAGCTGYCSGEHVHLGVHQGQANLSANGTPSVPFAVYAADTQSWDGARGFSTEEMVCGLANGHFYESQLPTVTLIDEGDDPPADDTEWGDDDTTPMGDDDDTTPMSDDDSVGDDDTTPTGDDDTTPAEGDDDDTTPPSPPQDSDGDGSPDAVDCNDVNASIYPGAPEGCNGVDNNCDGLVPAAEADADGDGVRVCQGDCNDANATIRPGATETCNNGIDNDCDGSVDEGCAPPTPVGPTAHELCWVPSGLVNPRAGELWVWASGWQTIAASGGAFWQLCGTVQAESGDLLMVNGEFTADNVPSTPWWLCSNTGSGMMVYGSLWLDGLTLAPSWNANGMGGCDATVQVP